MTTGSRDKFLVFVSHSSSDTGLASRVAAVLDSVGVYAFVYENYRVGGQNRFEVIKDRIIECPYFVLLLTQKARRADWVNQEIGFAAAKDKEIIPLVEISPIKRRRLPYFGFTELSDPLNLMLDQPQHAIGELLRTLMVYAKRDKHWTGLIRLACVCGWSGRKGVRDFTQWVWDCPTCQRKLSVSPLTFEPLPPEP